jgi:hypothetical protein
MGVGLGLGGLVGGYVHAALGARAVFAVAAGVVAVAWAAVSLAEALLARGRWAAAAAAQEEDAGAATGVIVARSGGGGGATA